MYTSQDGPALIRSCCYPSLSAAKIKYLFHDNSIQFDSYRNQYSDQSKRKYKNVKPVIVLHISNNALSLSSNQNKKYKPNTATESTFNGERENFISTYKRPCNKNVESHTCQSNKCIYRKDIQLYYVFGKPFNGQKEPHIAQESAKCTALCQKDPLKDLKDENKALKHLVNLFTESVECKCIANRLKQLIPHSNTSNPHCTCAETVTQADKCTCKCIADKLKRFIPHSNELERAQVEAETQGRHKYGGRVQRAGRESFFRDRGISACKGTKEESSEKEFFTALVCGFNEPDENGQKCVTSSTRCQAQCANNEQDSFKRLFRRLIKAPTGTRVKAKTQSPCYGGSYQRAGRESFCREIGTSGTPNQKKYLDLQENPREEVNYKPTEDEFYCSYKPVTANRRIGCNGREIIKCSKHSSPYTQKMAQTSTNCNLDDTNNDNVFTVFCNMMLQPTNLFPVSKRQCCKHKGTICQGDDNEGSVLKKYCELLIVPKNSQRRKSRSGLCSVHADRDEDNSIKKLCQVLLDPKGYKNKVKSQITGAEVMTQSRSYGGRQQRAGREIFCKNRGTSGAPKLKHPRVEKEEYEEVIEEFEPTCLEDQTDTNRAVGIGTNCKFSLGWYKDRHAYGEPKPQCDLKGAIEQWNEVPLRQTGTKIGASLKADSRINLYNINMATQSRKCRSRHLRAGRETFYKDAQTLCVPKTNKTKIDGNYYVTNQPIQPPSPDRRAIRFGSDCSFCFEISKDRNAEIDKSKPCADKIDENQSKNPFYSKLRGPWLSTQGNGPKAVEHAKNDAFTCTDVCGDECQCPIPKPCERRPLHIASKVSYDFNFYKSISPPKPTSPDAQEPCIKSSKQEGITKSNAAIPTECIPDDSNNYHTLKTSSPVTKLNFVDTEFDSSKSIKDCLLELVSKKNFLRLIKGDQNPKKEKAKFRVKEPPGSLKIPTIEVPEIVCPGECDKRCQLAEKPDQPFRVESSFSFDYNMRNVKPKHEQKTYEESFPTIEDFSGSAKKLNLFRLIIGKVRKRIKPIKTTACDPIECRYQKLGYSSWFTYILDSIRQARKLSQVKKEEEETKSFFADILLKPSACFSELESYRKKLRKDSRYKYLMSNIREQLGTTVRRPPDKKPANSFISLMLARKKEPRRRRRRRRRGRGKIIPKWYEQDIDALSSSILSMTSSRKSRTSDEDRKPWEITSDCCFQCHHKNSNDSDTETQASESTATSVQYATT